MNLTSAAKRLASATTTAIAATTTSSAAATTTVPAWCTLGLGSTLDKGLTISYPQIVLGG